MTNEDKPIVMMNREIYDAIVEIAQAKPSLTNAKTLRFLLTQVDFVSKEELKRFTGTARQSDPDRQVQVIRVLSSGATV